MTLLLELLQLTQLNELKAEDVDVVATVPEQKDYDRANGLRWQGRTFKGNNQPFVGEASKMAKVIKDPAKLVRRAKAVGAMYGAMAPDNYTGYFKPGEATEIFAPFKEALHRMGFSHQDIKKIADFKGDKQMMEKARE